MPDARSNRQRTNPAGLISRVAATVVDSLLMDLAFLAFAYLAISLSVWIQLLGAGDRTLTVNHPVELYRSLSHTQQIGAWAIGIVLVATRMSWMATWGARRGGPGERAFGVRVVDSWSYDEIGIARSMARLVLRGAIVALASVVGYRLLQTQLHRADLGGLAWRAGWLVGAQLVPYLTAVVDPRRRAMHDWLTFTRVIEAHEFSPRPRIEAELLAVPVRVSY